MADSLNLPPVGGVTVWLVAAEAGRETLRATAEVLDSFGLPWAEVGMVDAAWVTARRGDGVRAVVVASADGLLPGWWARVSGWPTVRVPTEDAERGGLALLREEGGELPAGGTDGGVFATMAIGAAGAKNAALFVVAMLAVGDAALRERWVTFREQQTAAVLEGEELRMKDEG